MSAAHGITRIERIVTDNGACCRADIFARALLGCRHRVTDRAGPCFTAEAARWLSILLGRNRVLWVSVAVNR